MPRSPTLPELRFVVVGAAATGKTTFMRYALDLKKPLGLPVASKKMSLEGDVFMIRLAEVQLDEVDVDNDYLVHWPDLGFEGDAAEKRMEDGAANRRIDGVLALYDVARRDTLEGIPDLLNACAKGNLPCVLVACKCDLPAASRKIDPREVEKSCMRETGIEGCQTFRDRPESHKRCISVVLRNVISNETAKGSSVRARAMTEGHAGSRLKPGDPQPQRPVHARAASEHVVPSIKTTMAVEDTEAFASFSANHASDGSTSFAPGYHAPASAGFPSTLDEREVESDPETPQPTPVAGDDNELAGDDEPETQDHTSRPRSRLRPGTPVTIANSLMDGENSSSTDQEGQEAGPAPAVKSPPAPPDSADGYSFNDLVDRLVSLPMTKEDVNFNEAFFCLYRKFAAPAQLLSALLSRWEALGEIDEPHILMLHSQLRIVGQLARWVVQYPGDCAYPLTRHHLIKFCERLALDRIFAAAAREMMDVIELQVSDDDLSWSLSDAGVGEETIKEYFKQFPELQEPIRFFDNDGAFESIEEPFLASQVGRDSLGHRRMTSSTVDLGTEHSASLSVGSFSTRLDSVEAAKAQAELLTPLSRAPLTKLQWRQFMEYSDEELASELTRMDWIMYAALQPRDLIRHVSLGQGEKEKCRSLDHLNRMINHFNHVSFWTASMILLRDKAKHRAKALEKFIEVARKLRVQNNYNSLAAIIAGINGTSVHRLAQTRELVPQSSQREFMKLEILMGTRKGYFAYRLAWENTLSEKVPFLPLHLRDLVATEEGNPTFMGKKKDRINWKKFDIMGETVVSIQESQGTPYPQIPRNAEMQRLILDGRISMDDEEDLYERSLQVEPRGPNEPRRKFAIFQR